jgi:putative transposase
MAATYLNLNVHIVFATKGRAPMIGNAWLDDLHAYLGGIARNLGAVPLAVGGVADHIHLLVSLKSTHCVADLVREIKKGSTAWARDKYHAFEWQVGYGAFSVSAGGVPATVTYIAGQAEHHRLISSAEELRAILAEHGVEFDERFFE